MGRCPACGEWNTMVEKEVVTGKKASVSVPGAGAKPMPLKDVSTAQEDRLSLGSHEVDRLLGGGIVKGSLVLMGGEPGIGKSTLSLQLPLKRPDLKTLYVTGEESARQVGMRARRLGGDDSNCSIFCETLIDTVIEEAREMMPDLMIVDSVQTMYTDSVESAPGSVSQIKEVAAALLRFAKESGVPVILIGHITNEDPRAYRGRGPAVRGREPRLLPRPAQHQEPLRLHVRAGRLRDDGHGTARSRQPF